MENNFNNYIFIYKDSHNKWNECTNPRFIAEHNCCRAIEKAVIRGGDVERYLKKINKRGYHNEQHNAKRN